MNTLQSTSRSISFSNTWKLPTFLLFVLLFSSSAKMAAQCLGTVLPPVVIPAGTYSGAGWVLNANTSVAPGTTVIFDQLGLKVNGNRLITVQNGGTLIIQNFSDLNACTPTTPIWQGIRVNAGGTIKMSDSKISNATNAINLINLSPLFSTCGVSTSKFEDNLTGINIGTFNLAHPNLSITTSSFSRVAVAGALTGIKIAGSTTATLFDILSPIQNNSFFMLTTGISSTNSVKFLANRNNFTSLTSGILMTNTAAAPPPAVLDAKTNTFTTCSSRGISLTGNINALINMANTFMNMPATSICISALNGVSKSIQIQGNQFNNYGDGILFQGYSAFSSLGVQNNGFVDNPGRTAVKGNNNINSKIGVFANQIINNTVEGLAAVVVTSTAPATMDVYVNQNSIKNFVTGIAYHNQTMMSGGLVQDQNRIDWSAPSAAGTHYGIKNTLCNSITTTENTVTMNVTSANIFTGVYYQNSDIVKVHCNRVYNNTTVSLNRFGFDFSRTAASFATCSVENNEDVRSQYGFRFTASVLGAYPVRFMGNRMDNESSAGLRLVSWGIGNQGAAGLPSWNRWWNSSISRTPALTPVSAFFVNFPTLIVPEIPTALAGCTFPSSGVNIPFVSPCAPAIVFKVSATNPIDLSEFAEQELPYAVNQNPDNQAFAKTETTTLNDNFYPNPANQTAYYEVEMPATSEGNIQVVDIQGRLLSQKSLQSGANKVEFNISEMPNGIYIYKVTMDKNLSKVGKFVVQH